ncbi:MFS transporter [Mucilaginibacter pallidiroseus]|uniref:MFS transporter n=1 Tax=Mucilaginibacter pallidiroseus TaxID=2599295 RepID=A0A563U5E8_9SPHI|nr:MFS transporter [Mucilaginibacter pallidiroseus]
MFRSLKYRNFKLFFYGQSISLMGTWMQKTAVAWLVYRLTGSAFLLGLVTFVSLIPSLILPPYAGSFIDRHDRFKTLVNTQIISMIQAFALAAMIYFKFYSITGIIFLSLVQGVVNAFDVTCRQSLMIDMVDDPADLPNAIALNSSMTNLARIVGPAIAGVVLSTLGEDFCFVSNFLSYIPVLICLYLMRINTSVTERPEKKIWVELREGFSYISSEKELSSLIVLLAISSMFVIPFNTLMPIFAKDLFHGTAKTFSLFESAIGLGALISAVYLANLKTSENLIKIAIVACLLFGAGILLLSLTRFLPASLFFMVLSGVGMMAQTSAINTYIQTHAAPNMRGRAISYYIMAYQGVIPVGSLLVGALAEVVGAKTTVAIEGIIGIVAAIGFVYYRVYVRGSGRLSLAGMRAK